MNTDTFSPNEYWLWRGKSYMGEERITGEFYRAQERFIAEVVNGLAPRSILEVGCGFGRITAVIAATQPECPIYAFDLSPNQIENAHEYCGNLPLVTFEIRDLYLGGFPPADLALAVEVFLHHPSDALARLIDELLKAAPVLVHDFDENPDPAHPEYCFIHDYPAIYRQAGATAEIIRRDEYAVAVVRRA